MVYSPRVWLCGLITSMVYSPRVWLLWVDDIDGVPTLRVAILGVTFGWFVATIRKELIHVLV